MDSFNLLYVSLLLSFLCLTVLCLKNFDRNTENGRHPSSNKNYYSLKDTSLEWTVYSHLKLCKHRHLQAYRSGGLQVAKLFLFLDTFFYQVCTAVICHKDIMCVCAWHRPTAVLAYHLHLIGQMIQEKQRMLDILSVTCEWISWNSTDVLKYYWFGKNRHLHSNFISNFLWTHLSGYNNCMLGVINWHAVDHITISGQHDQSVQINYVILW